MTPLNEGEFARILYHGTVGDYIKYLRTLLMMRMPYHFSTDNSKTSGRIQHLCGKLDLLLVYLDVQNLVAYAKVVFELGANSPVRRCIVKTTTEDARVVARWRVMTANLWTRIAHLANAVDLIEQ